MKLFTEYPEKDERRYYELLAEQAKRQMDKLYGGEDSARRDTHAKTHAAVRGTLEIFDFDEEAIKNAQPNPAQLQGVSLKQGLLSQPKAYPVWLRFANGRPGHL